ncbi:MAG: DUF3298 and DUF4163 domain-containing protein [Ruminococcus sp.]|nr:DUF3298 and DUF4163 domain-containing protein [Ruminococcus sp.]
MRKRLLYAAAASAMLLCSACSDQAAPEESEVIADDTAAETAVNETIPKKTETDSNPAAGSNTATEPDDASQYDESDDFIPQITLDTKEDSVAAEDGTILYTSLFIYPIVTIEGNEDAAALINADIQKRINLPQADTVTLDVAKADYEYYLSDEGFSSEYEFSAYYEDLDTMVNRDDSNVISFCLTDSYYSGGAHANYSVTGLNYSARTGELIAFADLGENAETFRADTLTYLQKLITTETYEDILFESAAEDLESVLYQDTSWYLGTDGLTFFSDPYALGPFASGVIEFTIPYSDLMEMGLKEEYAYKGNLTIALQGGKTYAYDINGDGQEESICFTIDDIGTIDAKLHLIINGTDYAQENVELAEVLANGQYAQYWADCYLYDMNMADDTIEIALHMDQFYSSDSEDALGTTFFYRYDKGGMFSYVDMIKGRVTDAMMELPGE